MSDEWQDRENEIFEQELKKSEERQAERDFLKDKSIAGENALRPSDEFIEENLGKDLNRQEIVAEAVENTDARMAQERADEEHRQERALGHREAEQPQQEQPQQQSNEEKKQQFIDDMRAKREQSQQQTIKR